MWCCQVNTGKMESAREKWMLIVGNLALKQVRYVHLRKATLWLIKASNQPFLYHYLHNCSAIYQDLWIFLYVTLILQLQATVLGVLASLMATVLGWIAEGKMPFHHVVLLCSTSVSTAFMASLLQGKNTTCCHFKPLSSCLRRLDRCFLMSQFLPFCFTHDLTFIKFNDNTCTIHLQVLTPVFLFWTASHINY